MSKIPEAIRKGITEELNKGEKTVNEIAECFDVSWHTVDEIRKTEGVERKRVEKAVERPTVRNLENIDAETSSKIFELFDEYKSPIPLVKAGYNVATVNRLWNLYLSFKGVTPSQILDLEKIPSLKKQVKSVRYVLLHIMNNICWISANAPYQEDVILCPHCHKQCHLIKGSKGYWVCSKCGKRPFDEDTQ